MFPVRHCVRLRAPNALLPRPPRSAARLGISTTTAHRFLFTHGLWMRRTRVESGRVALQGNFPAPWPMACATLISVSRVGSHHTKSGGKFERADGIVSLARSCHAQGCGRGGGFRLAPLHLFGSLARRGQTSTADGMESWARSGPQYFGKGASNVENGFPRCRKCGAGELVPLSDFGSQGASIQFKAWVCTNPECRFNVKIRNGDIFINEPVTDASSYPHRAPR